MDVNTIKEWIVLGPIKSKLESDCVELLYVFGEIGNEVIYVTIDGSVYAFGSNIDGVLGVGHNKAVKEPTLVKKLCGKQITSIQCNNSDDNGCYVLALTKRGHIYAWGSNQFGCLANGTVKHSYEPNLISALKGYNVIDVCCGDAHCLALTHAGEVYGWGYNGEGNIGNGDNDSPQKTPIRVRFYGVKIAAIACGDNHSIALSESGVVYGWGFNRDGQLGIGNTCDQNSPIKVDFGERIVITKVCGGVNHTLLLSSSGNVYACGNNKSGQIGDESGDNRLTPVKLNITKICDIYATHLSNISIAMSEEKRCYVWGVCDYVRPTEVTQNTINDAFNYYSKILMTLKPLHLSFDINERHINTFNVEKYSDLKFKVEGKYIYVQKMYLKGVCKHFRTMFSYEWREKNSTEVEITQYSYSVYYSLLKYFYTNKVEIKVEEVIELYDLANSYFEERLKNECLKIIKSKISVDNVCHLFMSAIKYNSQEIQDICVDFAFDKMQFIYESEGFKGLDRNTSNSLLKRLFSNDFQIIKRFKE